MRAAPASGAEEVRSAAGRACLESGASCLAGTSRLVECSPQLNQMPSLLLADVLSRKMDEGWIDRLRPDNHLRLKRSNFAWSRRLNPVNQPSEKCVSSASFKFDTCHLAARCLSTMYTDKDVEPKKANLRPKWLGRRCGWWCRFRGGCCASVHKN